MGSREGNGAIERFARQIGHEVEAVVTQFSADDRKTCSGEGVFRGRYQKAEWDYGLWLTFE